MVYPRKSSENTFFDPRRAAKGREENLCKVLVWSVREGRGRKPFLSAKGREGPRRKPLQDLGLVCPRRAGEKTFFVREGPRRATKKTFARSWFGLSAKGGGENLFCPRRAAKGHEENLCKILVWSVREGRGRKPFLSTKGHEGPRRATKKTSVRSKCGLSTRARGEHLFLIHEGPRRKPLQGQNVVYPRGTGSYTKKTLCSGRRS